MATQFTDAQKVKRVRDGLADVTASYIKEGNHKLAKIVSEFASDLDNYPKAAILIHDVLNKE